MLLYVGGWANTDHVERHVESRRDGFRGQSQLLDQLGIGSGHDHWLVCRCPSPRTAVSASVPAGTEISFPMLLEPHGGCFVDVAGCGQDAGRLGAPFKEARWPSCWMLETLRGGEAAGADRRDPDTADGMREVDVVDDLPGRNDRADRPAGRTGDRAQARSRCCRRAPQATVTRCGSRMYSAVTIPR